MKPDLQKLNLIRMLQDLIREIENDVTVIKESSTIINNAKHTEITIDLKIERRE